MTRATALRCLMLVFLALPLALPWVQRHHLVLWMATLALRSYGHFVALALVLWGVLELALRRPRPWGLAAVACTLAALYLLPAFWAMNLPGGGFSWPRAFGWGDPAPLCDVHTLVYAQTGDVELKLALYRPKGSAPAPFVVVVHGGGWDGGDRGQLPELNRHLAARGIATASVDYRLAPRWKWPTQREDLRAAIGFLTRNAGSLGLDGNRWVILGRSAGGQIAECVAFDEPPPGLRGCVSFYAPSDLDFAYRLADPHDLLESRQLLINYLGGMPDEIPGVYNDASALRFVTQDSAPTLLLHGPGDALVWHRHSERLQKKLRENGVRCDFLSLPFATHGFDYSLRSPEGQAGTAAVDAFLDEVFGIAKDRPSPP